MVAQEWGEGSNSKREELTMEKMNVSMRRMLGLALVVLVMLFVAISNSEAAPQPQRGGVMKVIDVSEGAQPIGAPWEVRGIDVKIVRPAIESLLLEDIKGNYSPGLATSWKIDTAKNTITLSLRKGVKFHDGTDFNAKAAKFCLDQSIKAKVVVGFLSVDVLDDYTIRINVGKYQNNFLNFLSSSYGGGMVSPLTFEKKGMEWAMWNPVGTGPFKFVSYERGSKLTYTRWDGYWDKGKPYLDGFEFLFIRDPMTQQAAMRASGAEKVHVLCVTSGEQAAMMKAQGFNVLTMPIGPVSLIPDSNNSDSPLSKKKVREAVSCAINREAIAKARGFGFWAPANQIPSPGQLGYVKDVPLGPYDPKKAKQLLAEAGYPNGFKIKIIVMPALVDRDAMVAVQRFLGEVGIEVELEFPDGGGYAAYRFKNGWRNAFLAQHTRMLATTNISYNFYWQTASGQFPSLKRTEGLLDKLNASLVTVNPEDARMQELTRMQTDDMLIIPIYYVSEMYVVQPNVHDTGYTDYSSSTVVLPQNAWLSK
jgi:peptide/nickel transport system substrate-binding protein